MIRTIKITISRKDLNAGNFTAAERSQKESIKNDVRSKKEIYEGILEFLQKTINEKKGDSE
jgi:hypothetical protein